MKLDRFLYTVTGCAALASALSASKCEHNTEIIPYVKEICTDTVDNDDDGATDCQDSDCDDACQVHVTINIHSPIAGVDSTTVSGTHLNATGIAVSVSPSGTAGSAAISGTSWTAPLTLLSDKTTYTVTAIASDAQGRHDTATATFTRNN